MNQNRSAKAGPCRTPARPARCVKCHGDPALMQDVIVFGSVITAAGLAVRNGLKSNETEMCDLCKGLGMSHAHNYDIFLLLVVALKLSVSLRCVCTPFHLDEHCLLHPILPKPSFRRIEICAKLYSCVRNAFLIWAYVFCFVDVRMSAQYVCHISLIPRSSAGSRGSTIPRLLSAIATVDCSLCCSFTLIWHIEPVPNSKRVTCKYFSASNHDY